MKGKIIVGLKRSILQEETQYKINFIKIILFTSKIYQNY